MLTKVIKRKGHIEDFDSKKIEEAIYKSVRASNSKTSLKKIMSIRNDIIKIISDRYITKHPSVEVIQDEVERALIHNDLPEAAKKFILYRKQQSDEREGKYLIDVMDLVDGYINQSDWRVKENANTSFSVSGLMFHIAGAVSANYALNKYPKYIGDAHKNGNLHIHDLSFGLYTHYCCGYNLEQLFTEGINKIPGKTNSNPPNHLNSATWQMINFIGTLQNEQSGAVAFSDISILLAPFIRKDNLDYKQVKQAMQGLIYNLNVPSRFAMQAPFSNFTLNWTIPNSKIDDIPIIGGKPMDFTYGNIENEMHMINKAFMDVLIEGDATGKPFTFPIPTVNITDSFDWNGPNTDELFDVTAKYGSFYFANLMNSDIKEEDIYSMCCRLRISLKKLRHRGGGLFGSNPNTGSIGITTLNLPLYSMQAKEESGIFELIDENMDIAKESLEIKRKHINHNMEHGLMPYTKRFPGTYRNHFSTIGIIGMHEMLMNYMGVGIWNKDAHNLAMKIMDHMNNRLIEFQEETGNLYNLEATPAEGSSRRLAAISRKRFPDIAIANPEGVKNGAAAYFTNSTNHPVDYTSDLFESLDIETPLLEKFTGGCVKHIYLGERLNSGESAKNLVRKVCTNYRVPYISVTPNFCYDNKTEILTYEGWKLFKDITYDDTVLTLNPETNEMEYQHIKNIISEKYNGNMIHFDGKHFDLLVTPNHKIFVNGYKPQITQDKNTGRLISNKDTKAKYLREAKDIKTCDKIPIGGFKWQGEEKNIFILPGFYSCSKNDVEYIWEHVEINMDDWLKFFGIWLAEGWVQIVHTLPVDTPGGKQKMNCINTKGGDHHCYRVNISQQDSKIRNEIEVLLKRLPFNYMKNAIGFEISNRQLWEYLTKFGNSRTKYIPRKLLNLSKRQLEILLEWHFKGDGCKPYRERTGVICSCSVSKQLREDLQEIYIKLGYNASTKQNGDITRITKKFTHPREIMKETKYNGKIYCVEVPKYNIIMVKRNGRPTFCGNSVCPKHGYISGEHKTCPIEI